MYEIIYEPEAEFALLEIVLFYVEKSGLDFGESINNRICEYIKRLEKMPFRSHESSLVPQTREFLIEKLPYKAFLKVDEENKKVFILNIIHTSRKFPN